MNKMWYNLKLGYSAKKEWSDDTCYNMNEPWKHKVKEVNWKDHIL